MSDEDKWGDWVGPDDSETSESSEPSEASEQPEGGSTSERSKRPEPPGASEGSDDIRKPDNVKEEWDGYYIYLPPGDDEILDRVNKEYERLRFECSQEGVSISKDRHFKTVLVLDGLERLEEMGGSELLERAEELGFR